MVELNQQNLIIMNKITRIFEANEVETIALSMVSLEIAKGEFVAIQGPSGCGKSTLLSIMGLLDQPTTGTYSLDSIETAELSGRQRARIRNCKIGFIFQAFNLIGDLTILENVMLPLRYRGWTTKQREEKAQHTLEKVDLENRMNHFPAQLSGGQQQRAAVARAIVGDPIIVLADEPTGNLDSKNAESVMEILADLHHNGTTICMVTHDPRFSTYANHTIPMFDGRIVDR